MWLLAREHYTSALFVCVYEIMWSQFKKEKNIYSRVYYKEFAKYIWWDPWCEILCFSLNGEILKSFLPPNFSTDSCSFKCNHRKKVYLKIAIWLDKCAWFRNTESEEFTNCKKGNYKNIRVQIGFFKLSVCISKTGISSKCEFSNNINLRFKRILTTYFVINDNVLA